MGWVVITIVVLANIAILMFVWEEEKKYPKLERLANGKCRVKTGHGLYMSKDYNTYELETNVREFCTFSEGEAQELLDSITVVKSKKKPQFMRKIRLLIRMINRMRWL